MKECVITKRTNCPHKSISGDLCSACKIPDEIMNIEWCLGYQDRGHGHGNFAIILKDDSLLMKCPSKELAEYIICLHNNTITE